MKVLMVNGSPHKNGCTQTALEEAASTIKKAGIDVDYYWIGNRPIHECIGCFACHKKNECIFRDDHVNDFVKLAADYDGFIFGTPVYYAGPAGGMISFMNRAFVNMYFTGSISEESVSNIDVASVLSPEERYALVRSCMK